MAYLFRSHWPLIYHLQCLNHSGTTSEILFASYQEHRNTRTEMRNLEDPLHDDVSLKAHQAEYAIRTFSLMLSSESGESIAKQIKMT